jgi:hypothetical protein
VTTGLLEVIGCGGQVLPSGYPTLEACLRRTGAPREKEHQRLVGELAPGPRKVTETLSSEEAKQTIHGDISGDAQRIYGQRHWE